MADSKRKSPRASRASAKKAAGDARKTSTKASSAARSKPPIRSAGKGRPRSQSARADSRSTRSSSSSRSGSGASSASSNGSNRTRGMSAMDAVRSARENIGELLGRPVESVLGVDRDHGNWVVTAQVVELERVPNTMDVLADYEAVLDKHGEVVGCRRTHRYRRGQVDEGQS
jgi:hypothetical protein